jgi:hypothetical protein
VNKTWHTTCAVILLVVVAHTNAWAKKWHYVFILPSDYVGWVQIVYGDPGAPPLPAKGKSLRVVVGESGVVRTATLGIIFVPSHDEFFYRTVDEHGKEKLIPIPEDYVLDGQSHGGFSVMDMPDGSPGNPWYFFIGPRNIRDGIPMADITKEKGYGHPLPAPTVYPVPGRMKAVLH